LDIGTTKVCAVVGARSESGVLEIRGVGTSPSLGMRRGAVVNIESMLRSVADAVSAAELMSGREVKHCWTSIGGSSVECKISRGVVAVNGKNREQREISEADIERVIDAARAVKFPVDREILEVVPQSYIVDSQSGIRNPLDMIGVRLESEVSIITCSGTSAQNLVRCVNRAGFVVDGLVLQTLAAGSAVLTEEEKDLGVVLIDLGGGTTDVLVYENGMPNLTFSMPVGGNQVSGDISIMNNVSLEAAEKIKIEAGCCWAPLMEGLDEEIIVPGMGGRAPFPIPRSVILQIIEPRMKETYALVKERLEGMFSGGPLSGGIVLTGGGANLLGAADLAAHVFGMPVRVGVPLCSGGLSDDYKNSEYATAVGLVIEGDIREGREERVGARRDGDTSNILKKMAGWIKREFF
jgi:cell division protein FtsA